ncbi:MAG: hypothetical protein MI748_18700, partial [Opitutales bacterium]|nr:hypothetical protein [Opitutales bacterium]
MVFRKLIIASTALIVVVWGITLVQRKFENEKLLKDLQILAQKRLVELKATAGADESWIPHKKGILQMIRVETDDQLRDALKAATPGTKIVISPG